MQHMGASQEPAPVYATIVGNHIHVRLGPVFTADLEIVKRIQGRRWQPDARVWRLPHSPTALANLRRGFGGRSCWSAMRMPKGPRRTRRRRRLLQPMPALAVLPRRFNELNALERIQVPNPDAGVGTHATET